MTYSIKTRILSILKFIFPALFVWCVAVITNTLKWLPQLLRGELPGNDDYMRIVTIRDWMSGQSWMDLTQYRLYPPDPLQSHWARLTDVLFAGILKVLTPLFGANAELIALFIFPSLLLLAMLILVTMLARHLSDSTWIPLTSALMAGLSFPVLMQFSPGRIDHHGLQIVMGLTAVLCLIKSEQKPRLAGLAGFICAAGLWVGIECLPYIGGMCIAVGLLWVLDKPQSIARLRYFAAALAAGSALFIAISYPPSQWFAPACDALSSVYVLLCAGIALALIACTFIRAHSPVKRLSIIAALGLSALALTLLVFPQCLKGPYSELDPRLAEIWLANVNEAKTFLAFCAGDPLTAISVITVPLLAVVAIALHVKSKGLKVSFIDSDILRTLSLVFIVTFAASLMQIRLMTYAGVFSAPIAALLMANALDWSEQLSGDVKRAFTRSGLILALSPLALPLAFKPFFPANVVMTAQTPSPAQTQPINGASTETRVATGNPNMAVNIDDPIKCTSPYHLRVLAQLSEGFAITQIDLGAPIMATTRLSVTSGPYHRNEAGNIAALDVFMGSSETAKAKASEIKADYVIACKVYGETSLITNLAPNGLLAQLVKGQAPSWLSPIDIGANSPIMVYKVQRD